jgi:hypothetical protein
MGRTLVQIGRVVWRSRILHDVMAEMGRVYLAFLAVAVLAGVGWWMQPTRSVMYRPDLKREGLEALQKSIDGAYIEPQTGQWWWELSENDFNRHRVIYNFKTKPGLQLLAFYSLLGLVGVGAVLHWTKVWVVVEVKRNAHQSDLPTEVVQPVQERNLPSLAGTVRITAMRGMIYISGLPDLATGLEDYGFIFRLAPVRVVGQLS